MILQTTKFGPVEVDEQRVITFAEGLLGFPEHHRYVLLQPSDDACFFWLQSMDAPDLAFIVTDPAIFLADYRVPLRSEQQVALGIEKIEDAQVFVIVNRRGAMLTGNLQGPLVVNATTRVAEQLVLADKRWHTRVELLHLDKLKAASA